MILRVLASLSVLLLFAIALLIILTAPQGKGTSISEHASSRKWSYFLFGCSLTLFGSLFNLFLIRYFGPRFTLPLVYYPIAYINWLCLLLMAWIPSQSGRQAFHGPHYRAAFGWGISAVCLMAALAFAHNVNAIVRAIAAMATLWYCFTIYLAVFAKHTSLARRLMPHYLLFQATNIVSFYGVIVAVSW